MKGNTIDYGIIFEVKSLAIEDSQLRDDGKNIFLQRIVLDKPKNWLEFCTPEEAKNCPSGSRFRGLNLDTHEEKYFLTKFHMGPRLKEFYKYRTEENIPDWTNTPLCVYMRDDVVAAGIMPILRSLVYSYYNKKALFYYAEQSHWCRIKDRFRVVYRNTKIRINVMGKMIYNTFATYKDLRKKEDDIKSILSKEKENGKA